MQKADYRRIAEQYDEGRSLSKQNMELWLDLVAKCSGAPAGARVLDLGCGTGRFAIPLAQRFGFRVTGADSSKEMLSKAKMKDSAQAVTWHVQDAQALSYADRSFDMLFMSHLLHHVDSPEKVIQECERVLDVRGSIVIRYGTIEQIRDDVEHTFFPEALAIDSGRSATSGTVEGWLRDAGFTGVMSREVLQQTFETPAARLAAAKKKGISVLTLISESAHQDGICRLASYVEQHPDEPWLLCDKLTLTVGHKDRSAS